MGVHDRDRTASGNHAHVHAGPEDRVVGDDGAGTGDADDPRDDVLAFGVARCDVLQLDFAICAAVPLGWALSSGSRLLGAPLPLWAPVSVPLAGIGAGAVAVRRLGWLPASLSRQLIIEEARRGFRVARWAEDSAFVARLSAAGTADWARFTRSAAVIRKEVFLVDDLRAVSEAAVDVGILIGGRGKLGKSSRLLLRRLNISSSWSKGGCPRSGSEAGRFPSRFGPRPRSSFPVSNSSRPICAAMLCVGSASMPARWDTDLWCVWASAWLGRPRCVPATSPAAKETARRAFRASALGFSVGVRLLEEGERDVRFSVFRHRLDKVERV